MFQFIHVYNLQVIRSIKSCHTTLASRVSPITSVTCNKTYTVCPTDYIGHTVFYIHEIRTNDIPFLKITPYFLK